MESRHLFGVLCCLNFAFLTIFGTTVCQYPKGFYKGMCVLCPANTLYKGGVSRYPQNVFCVERCSGLTPLISGRICTERCGEGIEDHQRGDVRYCRDKHLNKGFCPQSNCPFTSVCYFMKCFQQCPTFTVQYNNSCLIECLKDRPLVYNGSCVKECPSESKIIENGHCLTKCSKDRYLSGNLCVSSCSENQYIEENKCVSNCSIFTKIEGRYCLYNCTQNRYVSGNTCVSHCPMGQYTYGKQCVVSCPNNTVVEENKCLTKCSKGRFLYDTICLKNCPYGYFINQTEKSCIAECVSGYIFQNEDSLFCLQSCPFLTVQTNTTCERECPMDEPFYDDGFCLQKCPNSLKFISRETSPFNALLYKCVSSCSKYVSLNNLCVDMCQTNEVLYANACLLQCPKSDPFHVHLPVKDRGKVNITSSYEIQQPISAFVVCASKCPHNFVMDSGECYADCFNSSRKMIHNSSCFEKCPTDHPYMTKTGSNFLCSSFCIHRRFHLDCVENCPSSDTSVNEGECVNCTEIGMFEQGEECVNKCSKFMYENKCYDSCPSIAQFTFNNTCFRTCPDNVSLVDEQHYSNDALFVCVENCPGFKYVLGNQCVLKCPSYKQYHIEGKCISCQDIGKFDDGKKCADVCPEIGYNFRCIKQCPYGTKLYNKSCVMTCPSDMPVQLHDWKKGYYCEIKCPSGMFLFDTYCTYNCYGRYSRNYVYNDTCVDKCPSQASYLKSFRKYSRLLYHCVEDCEQGQVKLNKNCYNSCPENYHVFDGNCVLKCPREVPFIYRGHCVKNCSHYKLGFNCYDDCPPHLYRDNGTCLVTCPVHRPYDYHRNCTENCKINTYKMDGSCIDDCPPHLYRDNGTCLVTCPVHQPYDYHRNCTENCKINTYKMDRSCIDDCPLHLYRDNGTCLVTCPVHRPYDYERDCLESCKNNTYEADKSCYDTCPPGSFGYRDKCLPKCPTEAKFEYLGLCKERCPNTTISFNNTCISRCPKNKVEFQRRCIDECPELASFNNEGSCVSSCPNVKLGKKCYEDCPNKMNAYEKECVEKCPKHADFINKKNCVKRCPSYHIYLNCVNKCPENTYPHGMQCKSDCPKEAPFKKIGLFERNGDCLSSCGDYYLAAENMTCMRKSECKEYIDDIWCRKKCPLHTYLLYFEDQKYCKSLHPVYVWSGIFFIIIAADVAFGIRLLIYGRRILKENENEKKEELEVGEINVVIDDNDDN